MLYRGRHMKAWDPSIGPPSGGISADAGLLRDIMAAFDPLNPDGDDGGSGEFAKLYSPIGRESIPPERLMRALLLQACYSIRSERQLVERIDYEPSPQVLVAGSPRCIVGTSWINRTKHDQLSRR